jgi:hypothetical protein
LIGHVLVLAACIAASRTGDIPSHLDRIAVTAGRAHPRTEESTFGRGFFISSPESTGIDRIVCVLSVCLSVSPPHADQLSHDEPDTDTD